MCSWMKENHNGVPETVSARNTHEIKHQKNCLESSWRSHSGVLRQNYVFCSFNETDID